MSLKFHYQDLHKGESFLANKVQVCFLILVVIFFMYFQGFLGGSMVKNSPPSAGDMGLIPGPGGFPMPWSN